MQGLFNLALALLPLANAIPQYPGVVICDSTPVTDYTYNTKITEEVTGNYGDKGWVNYDAHTCQSNGEGQYSSRSTYSSWKLIPVLFQPVNASRVPK